MSSERPYSRHYHELVDDPKFADIYADDHHYATWSRLLMIADQAWPSSAFLPATARKASVSKLEAVGLIDLMPGGRFRMRGMQKEREQRSDLARNAANAKWGNAIRTASGTANRNAERTAETMPSKDETRKDETSIAREGLPNLTPAVATAWEAASGRTVLASGNFALEYVDDACRRHDTSRVVDAIATARSTFNGSIPTTQQLTVAVRSILDPLPDPKRIDQEAREAERAASSDRATLATLVRVHRNGAHADDRHPRCPSCLEAAATA